MSATGLADLVLVVDDFEDSRDILTELLERVGYECVTASDGAAALRSARALCPRVILLDLSLPEVSGWDVARALKADPVTAPMTIIACTAHSHAREHALALEAGCARVLTKPLDFDQLIELVRTSFTPIPGEDSARASAPAISRRRVPGGTR